MAIKFDTSNRFLFKENNGVHISKFCPNYASIFSKKVFNIFYNMMLHFAYVNLRFKYEKFYIFPQLLYSPRKID